MTNVSVFLDCLKIHFQDFENTHFLDILTRILKFGPENFGQVVILSLKKWQLSEEHLRKRYSTRIDFVSLLLEILLGSF